MPRAKAICSTSTCRKVVVSEGKCQDHKRPAWQNTSAHNKHRPRDWKRRRAFVLARDRRECYICHQPKATEVDHVIPVSRGGSHDYNNLRAVCPLCHRLKTLSERRAP
ncbi:HNH endonuclease [Nonomuraea sp. NPDC059007]|uniref:HNH endonuclease n=1 Tax=Nonomuraea sp. NPDC059007 TaxID=3346692 RepID=UPI00368C0717